MENSGSTNVPAALVYEGEIINARAEMLSLTDMWRAAKSPPTQRPDDWKNDAANVAFMELVAANPNAVHGGIWKGQRATVARWSSALKAGPSRFKNTGSTWSNPFSSPSYPRPRKPRLSAPCSVRA
jgi:hypothetical protein